MGNDEFILLGRRRRGGAGERARTYSKSIAHLNLLAEGGAHTHPSHHRI